MHAHSEKHTSQKLLSIRGGTLRNWHYLQEGGPLVVQASPHQVSVLGNHLYQRTSWCSERLRLALMNFFEDSFNTLAHFLMGDL